MRSQILYGYALAAGRSRGAPPKLACPSSLAVKLNWSPPYLHETPVERLYAALDRSGDGLGGCAWSLHGLENLGDTAVPDVVFTTQSR
jgi:hypothetical protein